MSANPDMTSLTAVRILNPRSLDTSNTLEFAGAFTCIDTFLIFPPIPSSIPAFAKDRQVVIQRVSKRVKRICEFINMMV